MTITAISTQNTQDNPHLWWKHDSLPSQPSQLLRLLLRPWKYPGRTGAPSKKAFLVRIFCPIKKLGNFRELCVFQLSSNNSSRITCTSWDHRWQQGTLKYQLNKFNSVQPWSVHYWSDQFLFHSMRFYDHTCARFCRPEVILSVFVKWGIEKLASALNNKLLLEFWYIR